MSVYPSGDHVEVGVDTVEVHNAPFFVFTVTDVDLAQMVANNTLQRELNTIENDIGGLNKHLAWRLFKSRIIWPGMAGIALCLGILGGSWALTQFFTSKIHSQTATVEKLRQTETELQARIADMEQRAGRIVLTKCDGRMCVQIDPKADGYTGRKIGRASGRERG